MQSQLLLLLRILLWLSLQPPLRSPTSWSCFNLDCYWQQFQSFQSFQSCCYRWIYCCWLEISGRGTTNNILSITRDFHGSVVTDMFMVHALNALFYVVERSGYYVLFNYGYYWRHVGVFWINLTGNGGFVWTLTWSNFVTSGRRCSLPL